MRLDREMDNFRAALVWTCEHGESMLGLRLAAALAPFWDVRGYLNEGHAWLTAMRDEAGSQPQPTALRARVLSALGRLAFAQGNWGAAAIGDPRGVLMAVDGLASALVDQPARAARLIGAASALSARLGVAPPVEDAELTRQTVARPRACQKFWPLS
jgi:hypothetical protein